MRADVLETLDAFFERIARQTVPGLRLGLVRHGALTARLDVLAHRGARRWSFHGTFHHSGGRRDLSFSEGDQTFARTASPQTVPAPAAAAGTARRLHLRRCPGCLLAWTDGQAVLLPLEGRTCPIRVGELDPRVIGVLVQAEISAMARGLRALLPMLGDGRAPLLADDTGHGRLAAAARLAAFPKRPQEALARLAAVGHRPEVIAAGGRALLVLPPRLPPRLPPLAPPTVLAAAGAP